MAQTAPFEVTTLVEGFDQPIAIQQAPDSRLFVAQKEGDVRVFDPGSGQVSLWAHVEVFTNSECGLLGLAMHPEFPAQPFVYLFATVSSVEQQIIRLRDQGGTGVEPTIIRDGLPTRGVNHNGGCLRAGPDGMLYFSVGDNGMTDASQSLSTLAGKICRINLDGSVPADNPLVSPTGAPRSVYALGFRNPFRFCFAPDGRLFVVDVGSGDERRREEINLVPAGANGGWPVFEGAHPEAVAQGFINPIFEYHEEGSSIAGCVVYDGRQFPSAYRGNLFHLDYTSHRLFRVLLEADRVVSHSTFVQAADGPVDLAMLQDGSLAWCELFSGRIRTVRYTGSPDDQVAGFEPVVTDNSPEAPSPLTRPSVPLCGQGLAVLLPLAALGLWARKRA